MMNLIQQFASVLDSRSDQHVRNIVDGLDNLSSSLCKLRDDHSIVQGGFLTSPP